MKQINCQCNISFHHAPVYVCRVETLDALRLSNEYTTGGAEHALPARGAHHGDAYSNLPKPSRPRGRSQPHRKRHCAAGREHGASGKLNCRFPRARARSKLTGEPFSVGLGREEGLKSLVRENSFSVTSSTRGCSGVRSCTAVVVSLGILPYIDYLDTFYQGVQLSLLAFIVRS